MKHKLFPWILVTVLVLGGQVGYIIVKFHIDTRPGRQLMEDPKYDQKNLLGLTYPQVIQRLGPPTVDTRQDKKPPTTQPTNDEFFIVYDAAGQARCTITFNDGKVTNANRDWK